MPKCEKCGKDILNAERRELAVLHISGVFCDVCYNLLNGLNWVMGHRYMEALGIHFHYKKNQISSNTTKKQG